VVELRFLGLNLCENARLKQRLLETFAVNKCLGLLKTSAKGEV